METLLIGMATAGNFIVLKYKLENERYADLAMDVTFLILLNLIFAGTVSGMTIAMVASAIISTYLLVYPPKLTMIDKLKSKTKQFFSRKQPTLPTF